VSELLQDLKFGARTLLKSRGYTAVALAILAIGIGANTAIFSFVNGVLLKPLPYPNPERIMRVMEMPPGGGRNGISTLNYLDWESQNTVFEFMAALGGATLTLTGTDEPLQLRATMVRAHYFEIYGIKAALGRTFVAGEDEVGHEHVAVLSHAFWKTQFGSDPTLVGRTIQLNREPYTVVGILPEGSAFDRGSNQVWVPMAFVPANRTRDFHWFVSFARLKPGVTLQQARAQMTAIAVRIAHDFPASNKGWGVTIDPVEDIYVNNQLKQSLYVLFAAVGMVLLIACANLANLSLARGLAREREVAIRASLGAGRGRMIRQFLTESVLLSIVGGALGLGLGYAITAGLKLALPGNALPIEADVRMDWRVLLFTFALAVLTGVVCGLFPAIRATRPDLTNSMKEGGPNSSSSRSRHRLRSGLVIIEVMLAFVLLTGAGLLIRSFFRLQDVEVAYDAANLTIATLPLPVGRFTDAAPLNAYLHQIMDGVGALPGVRDVAITSGLPMRGWGYGMPLQIAGRPIRDLANRDGCGFKMVSPSYFRTIGMRLVKGRFLDERDVKGAAPVMVINEPFAKKYFPKEDPIGQRVLIQEIALGKTQLGPEIPWEIVGIVAGEKNDSVDDLVEGEGVYVTIEQSPQLYLSLAVRGAMEPAILQKSILKAVHGVNKDQTLPGLKTLEQAKIQSMGDERLRSMLLSVFAGVALLLSAIGIYGVLSYSVAQRTREIGIRAALGATSGSILGLILRGGMTLVAIGLITGLGAVLALTRLLSALLYGVGERDPVTIGAVAVILAVVALLACYLPALRATKVDPIIALRYE
jgi:putative ABC transport system permease protein